MKKRVQGLLAGLLIGALLMGGMALAKDSSEIGELFYKNIRLFIDGAEITPKDANDNVVEPFIYNGTTYLPVRAVANAFQKDVDWDGETYSIYIGKKDQTQPDNYLDRIQYNDYKEGNSYSDFAVINGTITDWNNNIYTNGLLFYVYDDGYKVADDPDKANCLIAYPLNSQYTTLKGKIVLPKSHKIATWNDEERCTTSATDVWIYGDGKLLYKANSVTSSMPFNFEAVVKGVNQLTIKIKTEEDYSRIALTDLALYK